MIGYFNKENLKWSKLCLLNWVGTGGKAHNGAPVKMNENGAV